MPNTESAQTGAHVFPYVGSFGNAIANLGQAILTKRVQNIVVCGSQGQQSCNENKSAWPRQGSNAVRDTANFQ
jgi:hypothetical protein